MILADGHVHCYPNFDLGALLDSARNNFALAVEKGSLGGPVEGVLFFAETSRERVSSRLLTASQDGLLRSGWQISRSSDQISLTAQHLDGHRLCLILGRQVTTSENLEVLALGTSAKLPDRLSLEETLELASDARAVTVIPWGFGKWWFRRGEFLRRILDKQDTSRLFLGDNGGRLQALPRPGTLRNAEAAGFRILPGSDPLPNGTEISRVGSFGFVLDTELDPDRPGESLLDLLSKLESSPGYYGRGLGLAPFLRNQISAQLRKRFQRRTDQDEKDQAHDKPEQWSNEGNEG